VNATPALGATESAALPSGWRWAQLGELGTYINGRAFKPDDWGTSGLPIIRIQNLNTPDAPSDRYEGLVDDGHLIADGDLLISWSASLDAYIWDGGPAALNQHIFKVVVNEDLVTRDYLFYAVKHAMTGIRKRVHGATMQHVTKPEFVATRIPLPPLPDQQRIAAALREQLDAAARMRAAATRATSALSALHESRLRDILSSVADRAYPRVILGSVIKARNDIIHPRDNPSGHGVFVGLEHIESGTGRRVGSEEIDQATLTGRKARFHPGDIVYGYLRPYLNKVWLADFEGLCSVDQYVYVVDQEQADAGYVAGFMRSSLFLSQAPVASGPGQLPRIRLDEIARVELALPPLPEQRRIAAVLREQLDSTTHLRAAVEGQAAEIGRLTAALFRSAFLEGSS